MDGEQSHATLTITPTVTPEGKYYDCNITIAIRPYPNPLSYGGMFGGQTARDEEELEQVISSFTQQVESLKKQGMRRVEIIRQDERVITRQTAFIERLEQPKTETRLKPKQELTFL